MPAYQVKIVAKGQSPFPLAQAGNHIPQTEPSPWRLRSVSQMEVHMPDLHSDERTVVQRSSFNVANVIAAIALLLLVLGLLKFLHISPL